MANRTASILRRARGLGLAMALVTALPVAAQASTMIDRNASNVRLQVNGAGAALITYSAHGSSHHVIVWGAKNMYPTRLKIDYSGGTIAPADWTHFTNRCRPYDGPSLLHRVAACKAPDGSYWAVQQWTRIIPNYGGTTGARELRVSHWSGPLAKLEIHTGWAWGGRYVQLFGRYTYHGRPVYGFKATSAGVPLDDYGRNLFIDSYNPDYGPGWHRVNSFLTHNPLGNFCFAFGPKGSTGGMALTGKSRSNLYRGSIIGPGVTPDLFLRFHGQTAAYTPTLDAQIDQLAMTFTAPTDSCWRQTQIR